MERCLVWAGTDDWRAESALVRMAPEQFTAGGVQLGAAPAPYRLDHRLETGPGWVTRALELTAEGAGWRRWARLARHEAGGWTYRSGTEGEVALPDPVCDTRAIGAALDCDLGFSPLTNTMPVLRHGLHRCSGAVDLTMAWVSVPDLAVRASSQRYEHVRTTSHGAVVRFSSGSFAADLLLDEDGFVLDYPQLARRVTASGHDVSW
ncbi:putative glycolipid-binding domain-containing protein [Geodermatophilus sp. SYSU D00965]